MKKSDIGRERLDIGHQKSDIGHQGQEVKDGVRNSSKSSILSLRCDYYGNK